MKIVKPLFIASLGVLGACAPARVSGSVAVGALAYVGPPGLAYVGPGVEVVSDWDTPVFFADDFFWYWDGGFWFRSSVLGGERIRVREVPGAIARIPHPEGYAHFHAGPAHVHGDSDAAPYRSAARAPDDRPAIAELAAGAPRARRLERTNASGMRVFVPWIIVCAVVA